MRAGVFGRVFVVYGFVTGGFFEGFEQVLCVEERDDAVEIDGAAESFVEPEDWSDVAWVCEAGGFEQDVVESAVALHQRLEGVDALVFDGAADAAVGEVEPFGGGAGA